MREIRHLDGNPHNNNLDNLSTMKVRSDMNNTIKELNWSLKQSGKYVAQVKGGMLVISPQFRTWELTFVGTDENLGDYMSMDDAMKAAQAWIGDSE